MTPDEAYRKNFAAIDWSVPIPEHHRERPRGPRGDVSAPMLIRDSLPDLKGMHDGRIYDSRSGLYKAYKEAGVRVVEPGEGPAQPIASKISKVEVAEAYGRVKEGYKPAPLPTSVIPDP